MGAYSFNDFYSEFICITLEPKYMFEMLIWEFKYKLTLCFPDQLKSHIELSVKGSTSRLVSWSPITITLRPGRCSAWMNKARFGHVLGHV